MPILFDRSEQELQLRPDPERLLHEEVRPLQERQQEEEHPRRTPLGLMVDYEIVTKIDHNKYSNNWILCNISECVI